LILRPLRFYIHAPDDVKRNGVGVSTAQDSDKPAAVLPVLTNQKLYTVGTLVYTTGGLVLLFVWLLWGDFALAMRDRSVGPLIEKFLLKHGASNTLKQVLTGTLPTIISLVLGPIISYRSDRTRSRWGRRIPYLIIPTPIAGLAMVGIAFSPQMGEWLFQVTGNTPAAGQSIHEAASTYTMAIFTVLWTIFEVAVIISGSVFFGLVNDVVPRSVLGRFHGLFRAISLYDGILFNAILFKHAEQHFTLMFALVGLLFGGGFTLMCLKVKEGQYPPPPPEPEHIVPHGSGLVDRFIAWFQRFLAAAKEYLHECYAHPYYLLCFVLFTIAALTFRPFNDFAIRYAAQLKMRDEDYGFLVAVSYLCSLIIAFPLGMLVDKVHAIRMSLMAMVLYLLTVLYGMFFVHDGFTYGISLLAHTVLSGTYFTCAASLPQQLYPRSKYSQYASAGGIMTNLTMLIYAPIIGGAIDMTRKPSQVGEKTVELFNYHLTFAVAVVLSLASIILLLIVYQRFNAYGGTRAYVAPGESEVNLSKHEPPRHMTEILLMYFAGTVIGAVAGYFLAYITQPGAVSAAGASLASFHHLVVENKDVRGITTLCLATGIIPGAVIGGIVGTGWAKRRETA
jgi:Na+/melibiose symporter-like transporter